MTLLPVPMELIEFTREHLELLASWFKDEAAVVQWGGPMLHYPLDTGQMQAMLEEGKTIPPKRLCWMAVYETRIVGHVQLAFDWRNGNATLGRVAIAPAERGSHMAAPMLRLAIERAFRFPEIQRLELNVYTFNQPAIKTYEGLGFVHEGIRRSSTLVDGERWNTAIMAILKGEYYLER